MSWLVFCIFLHSCAILVALCLDSPHAEHSEVDVFLFQSVLPCTGHAFCGVHDAYGASYDVYAEHGIELLGLLHAGYALYKKPPVAASVFQASWNPNKGDSSGLPVWVAPL